MRESTIERELVRRVKAAGGEVRKIKFLDRRGAPDRLVMFPEVRGEIVRTLARTIWVELKAPGEKPEPHQTREHDRLRKVGQRVEVIDSIEGIEVLFS